MAKRIIILVALLVMVAGSAVQAQVGVDASIDFVSKYMWYGYDVYDDHGAYQPSVSYTFVETDMGSFGGKIWGSMPFGSGNENGWELDYVLNYNVSLMQDEAFQTDVCVGYIYYDYPKTGSVADAMELGASITLPNVFEFGLVPSYYAGKLWDAQSSEDNDVNGWVHIVSLGYDVVCPVTDQVISLSAATAYNGSVTGDLDYEWNVAIFGASTTFEIAENISLSPSINYQITMDEAMNNGDDGELWAGVSLAASF